MLGRIWALNQLSSQWKQSTTATSEKEVIADTLAKALTADKFWAVRYEAATALADIPGQNVRNALLAATKDERAKVRSRAVTSLAASKDATLASVYQPLLGDQSYAVIRAAAVALGQTKSPGAFDSLAKLLDMPSWHNTIRFSALSGLTELGDKRALDVALKFASQGDYPQVRVAAAKLLGVVGKGEPRAFELASTNLQEALKNANAALVSASAESLVQIGDPRGVELLERLTKVGDNAQYAESLSRYLDRLKKSLAGAEKTR